MYSFYHAEEEPNSNFFPQGSAGYPDSLPQHQPQIPSPSLLSTPEKTSLIQQQLVFLLHAHQCHPQVDPMGYTIPCPLPECEPLKNILNHMTMCHLGKTCPVPHCASSRQILGHWRYCVREDCAVCQPVREASQRQQNNGM